MQFEPSNLTRYAAYLHKSMRGSLFMFGHRNRMDAYKVFLIRSGVESLASAIIFTTWMVFQAQMAGLTAIQLVLVGTVMEVTIFVFEIPTGIVADVYSRRLSIIIGIFLIGLSFFAQAFFPIFGVILLCQVLWGLGYTFTSGASSAWIVDEIGEERSGQAFMRAGQVGSLMGVPGIILSVVLASINLALPLVVGGVLYLGLGLFNVLFMPENGFKPTPAEDRTTFQKMGDTFRSGLRVVRASPILISILGVGLFYGLYSEAWDRLHQLHLMQNFALPVFEPVVWFGALEILLMPLFLISTEIVRRRLDTNNHKHVSRALFWMTVVMIVGLVTFGVTRSLPVALLAFFAFTVARVLTGPVYETWVNQHIESSVRATVLSMRSQMDAIGQTVGGPPLGFLGQIRLPLAFLASAAILTPALYLLRRTERLEPAEPAILPEGVEIAEA